MTTDDFVLLAQLIPVFLLVVVLEDILNTSTDGIRPGDRMTTGAVAWNVIYRATLMTVLGVAEVYALLRALGWLPAHPDIDGPVVSVLAVSISALVLLSIASRVSRDLMKTHLVAMAIGALGVVASAALVLLSDRP